MLLSAAISGAMVTSPAGLDKRLARAKSPTSWQRRLDKALLDVDKTPEQRVRLLQKVAKDGKKIASDVRVAIEEVREKGMGKGHPLVLDLLLGLGFVVELDRGETSVLAFAPVDPYEVAGEVRVQLHRLRLQRRRCPRRR